MPQSKYKVGDKAAYGLNLRLQPSKTSTSIGIIPMGTPVTKLGDSSAPDWWEVSTVVKDTPATGFLNSTYLVPVADFTPPEQVSSITAVHMTPGNKKITRNGTSWAYPLNETGQPGRNSAGTPQEKAADLTKIVKWLDVEHKVRYRHTSQATFCNIYTYDYCYLAGVYLPRVWWLENAIARLKAGKQVTPIYDDTVAEINANSLVNWFNNYGPIFGWRRTVDLTELQSAANDGQAAIICAQHKVPNRHGHICAVVPETSTQKASRTGATVTSPLQSQAGAREIQYFARNWWLNNHKNFGFWINGS
ncbi:MAG TPA: SH3 domain-containing protein [Pyrinomonadaceae bacterium]|jgi:hypothetical protein